ncbi:hypothetical protein [Thiohalorhabdus methylotrophus]|uniref:AMIN domain-containing protein n=1 Tax=Thiohalorhabdus methylotrophus TaxID=3242694 RepID=A0ABV4TYC9_9GAMM
MRRFLGTYLPALFGGLLLAGCASDSGKMPKIGDAAEPETAKAEERKRGAEGLLKPAEAEPGMLYIRRRNADYTLELLLDTSSVNTAYDIELPARSGAE